MSTKYYMVGGSWSSGKNVWKIADDGASLSESASYAVGDATNVNVIVKGADGSLYIGTYAGHVYKYTSDMVLDTTWATSGIYTIGHPIYGLAVDSAGYVAIAHYHASSKYVTLLNASGAKVWDAGASTCDGYRTAFTADGDVIIIHATPSGTPCAEKRSRASGSILQNYYTVYGSNWIPQGLVVCSDGDIIIAAGNITFTDIYVRKCNSTDSEQWSTKASDDNSTACDLAMDAFENVYVGGAFVSRGSPSLFHVSADGGTVTYYNTGGTVNTVAIAGNGLLLSGGVTSTDQDSHSANMRVSTTGLVLQRYITVGSTVRSIVDVSATTTTTDPMPVFVKPGAGASPDGAVASSTIMTIGLFSIGSPDGFDAAHTAMLTVKDADEATICTKTFDDVTVFPTNDYVELGQGLGYSISSDSPVLLTITRHLEVSLPEFVLVIVYTIAGHSMCSTARILSISEET